MVDESGRTRSWLMVRPAGAEAGARAGAGAGSPRDGSAAPVSTQLYFGSAVLPIVDSTTGQRRLGAGFRSLLGFHRLYSRLLLSSAASRLSA